MRPVVSLRYINGSNRQPVKSVEFKAIYSSTCVLLIVLNFAYIEGSVPLRDVDNMISRG